MFDLNQLRCFVAVATELNFRRAAQRLNMTQPPLSRQIQQLEHILGAELFDRAGRSVKLTTVGRMFLPEAQDLLRRAEESMLNARRLCIGEKGQIRLGFITAAAFSLLPSLLAHVTRQLPDAQLILNEIQTSELVESIANHQLELGVIGMQHNDPRLAVKPIVRTPFVLAMHREYAPRHGDIRSLKDLDEEKVLMYSPSSIWDRYGILSGMFHVRGIYPNYVQYARHSHTLLSMVNAGIGVALVPEFAQAMGYSNLAFVLLDDMPEDVYAELCLCWRNDIDDPMTITVRDAILEKFPLPQGAPIFTYSLYDKRSS
ncbi:LysR family transcriptional regulator [Paracandidimonas soli]|uniref:LysR family transcriptional regulator n=2 Tax=Paracandidimonas soli TaxID=1917182 RepID=A0A4R3US48_9BURK|nr:LysR substrate-binding domain-containing protein [Paracandidimonas soli]TCU93681.1 LysR family transcriptional regulator [Paracandidimonas soli]